MFIKVNSSALKQTFADIKHLNCEVVSFTTENRQLIVTAGTSCVYETVLDIEESLEYIDTVINVEYIDISELLGVRDSVKLAFTQFSIELSYKGMSISLAASDTIVQRPDIPASTQIQIPDKDSIISALSIFSGLSIFQKSLQMDRPLQLFGDYALIQYPTAWIRVRSSALRTIVTREQATIVAAFKPTSYRDSNPLVLYRDRAKLIFPKVDVPDNDEFMSLLNTTTSVGIKNTRGLLTRIKKLVSTVGNCDCSVYVGDTTLYFSIVKNTLRITDKADCDISYSFDTRLEYVSAILNLIGADNDMEILSGTDIVCMRNSNISIILSTGR